MNSIDYSNSYFYILRHDILHNNYVINNFLNNLIYEHPSAVKGGLGMILITHKRNGFNPNIKNWGQWVG